MSEIKLLTKIQICRKITCRQKSISSPAMRALLFTTLIAGSLLCLADEPAHPQRFGDILSDPRQPVNFYQMLDSGETPKEFRFINNSILIICWMPSSDRVFGRYQIGGLEGLHTKERVERFLNQFYEADHQKESQMDTPNIILAGNNWGAGLEMEPTLKALSAKKAIAVYYVGGWAFRKAALIPEPDSRRRLIERTFQEVTK